MKGELYDCIEYIYRNCDFVCAVPDLGQIVGMVHEYVGEGVDIYTYWNMVDL